MAATGSNGAKRRSGRGSAGRSEQRPASASRNGKKQSGKSADSADTKREIIGVVLILVGIILGIFCYAPVRPKGSLRQLCLCFSAFSASECMQYPCFVRHSEFVLSQFERTIPARARSFAQPLPHLRCFRSFTLRICKCSRHELRKGCFPCMVRRQPPAQRRRFFRRKPCIPFCKAVRRHGRMCCTGGH